MSNTEFQPTLPAEVAPSDAEFDFMEQEPGGLFPQNQDSNFGFIIRKIWCDRTQNIADEQALMYNEKFPETSVQFLDVHEQQYGLPVAPTTLTIDQRRSAVLNRIRVGPFTNARRSAIVESYITATFGTSVQLLPPGVPIVSGGILLYGEPGDVSTLYAIRENQPANKNLVVNSNFEANVTGWAPTACTMGWYPPGNPMYGTRAADVTCTSTAVAYINNSAGITVTPGLPYSESAWVQYLVASPGNRQVGLQIAWYNGGTFLSQVNSTPVTVPKSGTTWVRLKLENAVAPANANLAYVYLLFQGGTPLANDEFFVDGVQFEQSAAVTDYADPSGNSFFYEVRIKNTVTPDLVGLNRELTRITPAGISYAINFVATP